MEKEEYYHKVGSSAMTEPDPSIQSSNDFHTELRWYNANTLLCTSIITLK